jgi:hypothetical protein
MLVGPCRDFTCPHCGALYKPVRVPKFESNRLDYDRILASNAVEYCPQKFS